jgi:hypothetical protein
MGPHDSPFGRVATITDTEGAYLKFVDPNKTAAPMHG